MDNKNFQIEAKILNPLLGNEIPLPDYATDGAAGIDLRACIAEPLVIQPQQTRLIGSGMAISIYDRSLMAVLAPRSGLGVKHRLVLANLVGIIDSDYQDEIKIALWNAGDQPYTVQPGERICQMLFVPVAHVRFQMVAAFSRETARGIGGLGHTGRY